MEETLTICVVSDAPNLPTGLARIARDLTALLHSKQEEFGIKVCQLGYGYDGSPWPWAVFPMIQEEYWGKGSLEQVARWLGQTPIVFTIWDAGRCFGLLEGAPVRELWGYFPIDSFNPHGKIGGPGAETIRMYNKVLGYGEFGSTVIKQTRGDEKVQWLPHGLDLRVFDYAKSFDYIVEADGPGLPWLQGLVDASEAGILVGGVATNQPRKDLALFFATAAKLRERWPRLSLWLHSDIEVTEAWSIPELASVFGFNNNSFTLTTHPASDAELAIAYSLCHCTLAVGAGEGFGYPIVESLACGTPVIHGDFAGGAELIPIADWKVEPLELRIAGSTALFRPLQSPEEWAYRATGAITWKLAEPAIVKAYCRGAVKYLDWTALAPRWVQWFRRAIAEEKAREKAEATGELDPGQEGMAAIDDQG